MAAPIIAPVDLDPFTEIPSAKAREMVKDALARAARVAPCITAEDFPEADREAVKAILRGAILRWAEAGTGAVTTQTAGPFGQTVDTTRRGGYRLWPSEIKELQEICSSTEQSGAFNVDTIPGPGLSAHAAICAINFGASYCSCGAVLTNLVHPLYEE